MEWLSVLQHPLRSLLRRPRFALVAVLTMALGIGANTVMFSVIHATMVRPLPLAEPARLLRLYSTYDGSPCCPLSAPNFLDLRESSQSFTGLVAFEELAANLTGGDEPVRISGWGVSGELFEVLGITPRLGRVIASDDDRPGAEPVVMLSDRLWRQRFGADREVVGQRVALDGIAHTVIGVTPHDFRLVGEPDLFVPLAFDPDEMPSRGSNYLTVIGRLAPGRTREAALAELETRYAELVRQYPNQIANQGVAVRSLDEWLLDDERRTALFVLWGAVGLVLLVACANVANLLLARAEERRRELAVRAALGASRRRLLWHFLAESLTVTAAGAALGVVIAYLGTKSLLAAFAGALPARAGTVELSAPVLWFAVAVALATGLAVGIVPALQTDPRRLERTLRSAGRGTTQGNQRLRRSLVVLEVAAALVVAIGAGLLLKSFWQLNAVDIGTEAERVLTAHVALPAERYADGPTVVDFQDRLIERVRTLPAVEAAGLTSAPPFSGTYNNFSRLNPTGHPDRHATFVESRSVSSSYFDTLGIGLRSGRLFSPGDHEDASTVVVINTVLADQLFPGADPIDKTVQTGPQSEDYRVVGVVESLREHGPDSPPPPTIYFSHRQWIRRTLALTVRTSSDPRLLLGDLRSITRQLDPDLPLFDTDTLDELLYEELGSRRFLLTLLTAFAALGLLLGGIGTYSVLAHTVAQRTRELGVRQALGATPADVLRHVLLWGLRWSGLGIALGLLIAYLSRRALASMVFSVGTFDPGLYATVAGVLLLAAVVACWIPARRAASVDPVRAIRAD